MSIQPVSVHGRLREHLHSLQTQLRDPGAVVRSQDLQAHCLGFCAALTTHHEGEDAGLFPALRQMHPELTSVIDHLVQDHELIASILRQVEQLAVQIADATPERRDAIACELDRLAASRESHFVYEERRISAAIDHLPDVGWSSPVFDLNDARRPQQCVELWCEYPPQLDAFRQLQLEAIGGSPGWTYSRNVT